MKFSTRLKKMEICVSNAKGHIISEHFESYSWDDFTLTLTFEDGFVKIKKMNSLEGTCVEILKKKNYSKKICNYVLPF